MTIQSKFDDDVTIWWEDVRSKTTPAERAVQGAMFADRPDLHVIVHRGNKRPRPRAPGQQCLADLVREHSTKDG